VKLFRNQGVKAGVMAVFALPAAMLPTYAYEGMWYWPLPWICVW